MHIYDKDKGQTGVETIKNAVVELILIVFNLILPHTLLSPFCDFLFGQVLRKTSEYLGANIQVLLLLFFAHHLYHI